MRKFIAIWLISCLIISPIYAAHILRVNDNSTIRAIISAQEPTRISVAGDRIVSMRSVEGAYTYKNDNTQGAIFIKPTEAYQHKPFYIFITTEQSHNYVLLLTPTSASAGMLVLKPKAQPDLAVKSWESSPSYETTLMDLMRLMVNATGSEDYAVTPISKTKTLRWNKQLNLRLQTVYEGAQLRGEVYLITNRSRQPMLLKESLFYNPGDQAIALQSDQLPAQSQTLLYKVTRHG